MNSTPDADQRALAPSKPDEAQLPPTESPDSRSVPSLLAQTLAETGIDGGSPSEVETREVFLATVAHELRTPVTRLRLATHVLRRDLDPARGLDPERAGRLIELIDEQAKKLTRLITYLLDVSSSGSGALPLECTATDLVALAEAVVAAAQLDTASHQIRVVAALPVEALVDADRLEQVLVNLLDNAVKYSPEGGEIEVQVDHDGPTRASLAVRDHGVGVSPSVRPQMFDRFTRAHDPLRPGLGLGLYLSRRIVELHGGELTAEFPADGGTRIVAILPASQTPVDGWGPSHSLTSEDRAPLARWEDEGGS